MGERQRTLIPGATSTMGPRESLEALEPSLLQSRLRTPAGVPRWWTRDRMAARDKARSRPMPLPTTTEPLLPVLPAPVSELCGRQLIESRDRGLLRAPFAIRFPVAAAQQNRPGFRRAQWPKVTGQVRQS